jgi:putative hydrolase of the HAD superfamily
VKIATIFFDLGKVLVDYDFNVAIHRMASNSPLKEDELNAIVAENYRLIDAYETGTLATNEFFSLFKEALRFEGPSDDLRRIWCDVFFPIPEHIQLARQLAQGYPLAIVSNTCEAHVEFLENAYDFFPVFKKRIYSHEVGSMKPSPDIYNRALETMNADRFEALFIDDREENVLGASRMGWQTIHLRPEVSLRDALRSYDLRGV